MKNNQALIQRDKRHIWHPGAQYPSPYLPLVVEKAQGSYLYTDQGPIIDAISSWWCKSLGHGHPFVLAAVKQQLAAFEHVISANTTHPTLVELGEKLAEISNKQQVFFASDGSSAVEIALKLTLHAMRIRGEHQRNTFITLQNSYHGETFATLSVSDLGFFKKPYEGYGLPCQVIDSVPYVANKELPLWQNAEESWQQSLPKLEAIKTKVCAVLVEPIIQGSGGMLCYSADFLKRLAAWTKDNGIYLIADEIMTGLCRSGKWLACQHAQVEPDLICLSKGLTSGMIPMSCVLIDKDIHALFHQEHTLNTFVHSHTYSAHALGLSAALATLQVMESENMAQKACALGEYMHKKFKQIASETQMLTNIRSLGAMVAADLKDLENKTIGPLIAEEAIKRGALLRPLGNTLYWLPPLTTDEATIDKLAEITLHSIYAAYG